MMTGTNTVSALDDFRPPTERIVGSYEVESDDGIEHVTLDEPVPESEIPNDVVVSSHIMSMEQLNEGTGFVIVHKRIVSADTDESILQNKINTDESGIVKCIAPTFDVTQDEWWKDIEAFDTWQEAEAYIANNFEQPDDEHEFIIPILKDDLVYDVEAFLVRSQNEEKPRNSFRFHKNTPNDDEFMADASPINR